MRVPKLILAVGMSAAIVLALSAPDAQGFMNPQLARIIFFHLPCAIASALLLFVGGFYSLRYLRKLDWADDVKSVAALELCALLGVLCMVTGMLFSKMQWNEYWSWDPRQTSFLMVLLLLSGYFSIRSALPDDRRRASVAAAYSVASQLPAMFLIFVYPRLPHVKALSLHPSTSVTNGGFDRHYGLVVGLLTLAMIAFAVYVFRLRVRAGMAALATEVFNANLDNRLDSAGSSVVRPVPVLAEDREVVGRK